MTLRYCLAIAGALLLVPMLSGCQWVSVSEKDKYFDSSSFLSDPPNRIAIMPFANSSGKEQAGEIFRKGLYGALTPLHYEDLELAQVDSYLNSKAVALSVPPDQVHPSYIANDTALADAVIFGEVLDVSRFFLLFFAQHKVDVRLAMVETGTRKKLYQNRIIVYNRSISFPTSLVGIANSVWQSIWFMRSYELDETMEDAAAEIVQRFPAPLTTAASPSTYVTDVDVKFDQPRLSEGQRIAIVVNGAPGQNATFSIGELVQDEKLTETSPGRYEGGYFVQKGDDGNYYFVTVALSNPNNPAEVAKFQATDRPFAIDTTPPPPYQVDSWVQAPGKPGVTLRFSPENRLAQDRDAVPVQFNVYRANGEGKSPEFIGSSLTPEFEDPTAEVGEQYEYAVVAIDAAGNTSDPRSRVLITPQKLANASE